MIAVEQTPMGQGVVALADLPPFERVCVFMGPRMPYEAVPDAERRYALGLPDGSWLVPEGPARYVNHGCEPNCEVWEDLAVVTIRPVARGEQLTIAYDDAGEDDPATTPWDPTWSFDCHCGAASCVGRIDRYRRRADG